MSRVGKKPIKVPSDVKVKIFDGSLEVECKKVKLTSPIPKGIHFKLDKDELTVSRDGDNQPMPSLHGLARSLAANNIIGVSKGFSKSLDVIGIGYKVEAKKHAITFSLGYSHPIEFPLPEGIEAKAEKQTRAIQNYVTTVIVSGPNKQQVGQVAADLRSLRKPDPYKGKGIRYSGEYVRLKVGKKGA